MFNSSQYISTTVWPWSHQLGPVMNTMHSLILLWTQSQFLINMKLSSSSVHRLDPFHGYNMMHYFSTSFGPCSRLTWCAISVHRTLFTANDGPIISVHHMIWDLLMFNIYDASSKCIIQGMFMVSYYTLSLYR